MPKESNPDMTTELVKSTVEQLPLKDAYVDVLQPSLRESGKTLQTVSLLLNRLLSPIRRRLIEGDLKDLEQGTKFRIIAEAYTRDSYKSKFERDFPCYTKLSSHRRNS